MKQLLSIPFFKAIIFFQLLFSFSTIATNNSSEHLLWTYRSVTGSVDATPAAADIDGDGVQDVIMATTRGTVLVIDFRGNVKWQYDVHQTISNPICIAGNPLKVFALTDTGSIVCIDAEKGEKLWEYAMPAGFIWGATAPAAADIDGNGTLEIIVADRGGHLVALTEEGVPLWKMDYKYGFRTAPALADLDGNGSMEIIVGTEKKLLVCFSNKGKELWNSGNNPSGSSPQVMDINGDGMPEILIGTREGILVCNAGGQPLWNYKMKGEVHDAITVADINNNGKKEVVVVDLQGKVACLSHDGHLQWAATVPQRARRSPTVGDIDGDGKIEIIVGSYAENLTIFDIEGNLKEEVQMQGGMNSSPLLVDYNNDGKLVVVCATTFDVEAFSLMRGKGAKGSILFGQYRINAARTGTLLNGKNSKGSGILSIDYGTLHTGVNKFTVTVRNPQRKHLSLAMILTKGNERSINTTVSSSDTLFSGRITYSIPGDTPLPIRFNYKLKEKGKTIADNSNEVYLIPFAKDLNDLQKELAKIRSNLPLLKEKDYVNQQLNGLEKEYKEFSKQSSLAGVMSPLDRATLRTNYEKAWQKTRHLSALVSAAATAGNTLVLYRANPWAPYGGIDEIQEGRTPLPNLSIEAFGGETESAALNIANYSDHTITVRIEPGNFYTNDSSRVQLFHKVLTFHEVLDIPTHSLDMSADALPRIGQGRTIILSPWSMRQVWVNINTTNLDAGNWSSQIHFRTLEVEPVEAVVPLNIKVWPVSLTKEDPLRLCHWGYVESSILKDMPDDALLDQVQHGTNVFVATGRFSPPATFDEDGNLIGKPDFTTHDEYVKRHAPHGLILFFSYQSALKGPAKKFTPEWEKAYKQWILEWRNHLFDLGFDYGDFAFYPIDEPGLREGLVEEAIKLAKPIHEADPRLQVYADPVADATMSDLKKMSPYFNIWCPNRNGYLRHDGNDKLEFLKSTGSTVWTYECEGDAKHQSPLGYYRSQSWLAWWRGLTGIGFWSYCTSSLDPWYVPKGGQDYLLIYQGDGVVTSKRWEAVRDGKEDYNMLKQLSDVVKNPQSDTNLQLLKEAALFLKDKTAVVAAYCGLDNDGNLPVTDGMVATRKIEDRRWKTIQQTRREMAELLIKLIKKEETQKP